MHGNVLNCLRSFFYIAGAMAFMINAAWAAGSQPSSLSGNLTIGGTGAALGTMQKLADEFKKSHPDVHVKILPSLGSGGGIKALIAGQLAVGVSSRPITDAERSNGVAAREIAKTPFVFVTGPNNPVNNVTLDELAGLYSGKTTNWPDGDLVRPVLRPLTDIDTQLVKAMSPALAEAVGKAHHRPGKNIAVTDTDSANELEQIPGAIGTSTLSLIKSENRRLKVLIVDGVEPSIQNVSSKKYPYLKSIYLVAPSKPSPMVQAFTKFIDSASGKAILIQTGNIPSAGDK